MGRNRKASHAIKIQLKRDSASISRKMTVVKRKMTFNRGCDKKLSLPKREKIIHFQLAC